MVHAKFTIASVGAPAHTIAASETMQHKPRTKMMNLRTPVTVAPSIAPA